MRNHRQSRGYSAHGRTIRDVRENSRNICGRLPTARPFADSSSGATQVLSLEGDRVPSVIARGRQLT
jgi:hypothetical protein